MYVYPVCPGLQLIMVPLHFESTSMSLMIKNKENKGHEVSNDPWLVIYTVTFIANLCTMQS